MLLQQAHEDDGVSKLIRMWCANNDDWALLWDSESVSRVDFSEEHIQSEVESSQSKIVHPWCQYFAVIIILLCDLLLAVVLRVLDMLRGSSVLC